MDLTADTRYTHGGYHVNKAGCFFCNSCDTFLGSRRDHGDHIDTVFLSDLFHFFFLLKRNIRGNKAVYGKLLTFCKESLIAIMEYRIDISHENKRNIGLAADLLYRIKQSFHRKAVCKCTDIGVLDHNTFRCRI